MIGALLKNRYEILEKIGDEELFAAYKCEDKINCTTVTVKILRAQYSANHILAERMLVDAQAMMGISHPGIVEVFDFGKENGEYFVVVEHIRGTDLKERIRRSAPFTLATAVDVGLAICDVLDFMHRRGFVHGDLRPGSIMVTSDGQIKIADFWMGAAIASQQSVRMNVVMSSPQYVSPEVSEGKPITPASDLYSLGVILFELLTGTVPFDGETPIAIALKHARDPVPHIRAINPSVPRSLEAIIGRELLQKAPVDRFRSARSMLHELKSARDSLHLARPLAWNDTHEPKSDRPFIEPMGDSARVMEPLPTFLIVLRNVVVGFILLFIVAIVVYVIMLSNTPREVRFPDMIGKTYEDAEALARGSDIQLFRTADEYNEQYPAGEVYFVSPEAGRSIKSGRSVKVWVSRGSKYTKAPDLGKLTLDDARQRIQDAGLDVGMISQDYSDAIPANSVISQKPDPGTRLEHGQSVDLVYSLGPKPEELPTPPEPGSEASTPPTTPAPKTRSFDVKFTVPAGPKDQAIEIVVHDVSGDTIAYNEVKHPGDKVQTTVQGAGEPVIIKVLIDGVIKSEESR